MQVFKPSDITHTLVFIPRVSTTTVLLKIRNELRDTENSIGVVGSVTNNVFMGSFSYDFKEGGTYEIEVVDNLDNLLFRGKAFATDVQDLQNYKLIR